jgi:hypothetical protein
MRGRTAQVAGGFQRDAPAVGRRHGDNPGSDPFADRLQMTAPSLREKNFAAIGGVRTS